MWGAIVLLNRAKFGNGLLVGLPAPTRRCENQMVNGINFFFGPESAHITEAQFGKGVQGSSRLHHLLDIPIRNVIV